MKNLISYYYSITINELKKIDSKYEFIVDNIKYIFIPYVGNIEDLKKIYLFLKSNNIYCHEIILNKDNSWITYYTDIPYILIKINISSNNIVTFNEMLSYDMPLYRISKLNWKKMWEEKIDYYEYQMSELGFKFKYIRKYFNYYVGLCETAISLLNTLSTDEITTNIQHKKIKFNDKVEEFYNPINIIEDIYVRDIAEYIKSYYFEDCINNLEILDIIKKINLNTDYAIMLLSRMLYPNYFFDMYDRIIKEEISEEKIENYIKKSDQYETLLKSIYKYLVLKYNIPNIEWLNI